MIVQDASVVLIDRTRVRVPLVRVIVAADAAMPDNCRYGPKVS
jgi:hypothetical protein